MTFAERLVAAVRRRGTPAVVGIDPRPENLPKGFLGRFSADLEGVASALGAFSREVVEVVAPRVPAVKLQSAFFEAYGPAGVAALHEAARHARRLGLLVILDAKRNDIGSTAEAYARAYLGRSAAGDRREAPWDCDALTVTPYLGSDGVAPFVRAAAEEGRGLFVLVRTSNPSAVELQDLVADGRPVYRHVADLVASWAAPHRDATGYSPVGAVVGATYPDQLAELRDAMPGVIFLVPGYGAQGGTAKDVAAAFDGEGLGAIVNSSRGVTFAYERPEFLDGRPHDWRGAIERAVVAMVDDLAANTPAGLLRRPAP